MNTRLQVEHPVTEAITGLDLVALQFRVASGAPLGLTQGAVGFAGHAIEARLYAEDPAQDFLPQAGTIDVFQPPAGPGLRTDAGITSGQPVVPFYDPMLAKIVAWGQTRDTARRRLVAALTDTVILGPTTNRGFLIDLLQDPDFAAGMATTALIADRHAAPPPVTATATDRAIAAALMVQTQRADALAHSLGIAADLLNWSSGAPVPIELTLTAAGTDHTLTVQPAPGETLHVTDDDTRTKIVIEDVSPPRARLLVDGRRQHIHFHAAPDAISLSIAGRDLRLHRRRPGAPADETADGRRITAPMHGLLTEVDVSPGADVTPGTRLAVLEAMKMQHPITAPAAGKVTAVHARPGNQVAAGALLVEIEPVE